MLSTGGPLAGASLCDRSAVWLRSSRLGVRSARRCGIWIGPMLPMPLRLRPPRHATCFRPAPILWDLALALSKALGPLYRSRPYVRRCYGRTPPASGMLAPLGYGGNNVTQRPRGIQHLRGLWRLLHASVNLFARKGPRRSSPPTRSLASRRAVWLLPRLGVPSLGRLAFAGARLRRAQDYGPKLLALP